LARKLDENEKIKSETLTGLDRVTVDVKVSSPTLKYIFYDPAGSKPPEIKGDDWKGFTSFQFECNPDFTFYVRQIGSNTPFVIHFEKAIISIGFATVITLPNGDVGKLKKHEEGHKKVDDYFYSLGQQIAQRAGEFVTDKEINVSPKDIESAKQNVLAETKLEFKAEYWKNTKVPCEQANKYYDELTDHGRNNIDSDEAAQQAIKRYELQLPN
jgi:hypothetical protein